MKKIILPILFLCLSTSFSFGQEEEFLKVDKEFVNSLSGSDDDIDQNLDLSTFKGRFQLMDQSTALNIDYNDVTYTYVKKYLNYKWYGKVIGLSNFYFPLFEAKLRQYGLPPELKYLAIVESNLNPRTVSHAGAKGLWQFMPATGAEYGLMETPSINTFYDTVAITDAACRYLRYLYKLLRDWNLVLSAYNSGQGTVLNAIKKAGTREYWKVRPFLPSETRAYVPSFVAVNYMFNFYKYHNIRPNYFRYQFSDFQIIRINNVTNFRELSFQFKTDYELVKFANPQFTSEYIPAGSIVYVLK